MRLKTLQREAFYYAQKVEHPAFFLTKRVGKSILTIKDLIFNNSFPALICGSLSTIYGWESDFIKCGLTKNDYQILIGDKDKKFRSFKQLYGKSIILTNKEFFLSIPELIKYIHFKSVALDESTCIKNHKTAISKFFTKQFINIKRRYILTGTPMLDSELEIFCQLQFLDPTILDFKSKWDFKNAYFYQYGDYKWLMKPSIKSYFYNILNQKCCFITLSDVRKSIGKENLQTERYIRTFKLNQNIRYTYNQLKDNFLMAIDKKILFGFQEILQQIIYLRKLCSGFITTSPETKITEFIDDSKYNLLLEIIQEESNLKILILCNFYDEIYKIEEFFKVKKIFNYDIITGKITSLKRGEIFHRFQNDQLQYVIANAGCIKHGVTLSNADMVIEFSNILGHENRDQVEIRGTDIYKDDKILITHLIAENTIEEYFFKQIDKQIDNKELIEQLINFLRKD